MSRQFAWTARCLMPALLLAAAAPLAGQDPQAALRLLPEQSLFYVQAEPATIVDFAWEHPLRAKIEESAVYQQAILQKQFIQFRLGLAFIENQIGRNWRTALTDLTGGGVHFAFEPAGEASCLLVQAKDAEFAAKCRGLLLRWSNREKADTIVTRQHAGVSIDKLPDGKNELAVWDGWIALCNKPAALDEMIDRSKNGGRSLADHQQFQQALGSRPQDLRAWAFFDLEMLRKSGGAKELFAGKTENPLAELLVGGVMSNLQHAAWVTSSVEAEGDRLRLTLAMPFAEQAAAGAREHFFGPGGKGQAPGMLQVDGALLNMVAHRDAARMWLQADDLYPEEMVDGLAQADSNLSTLFGGRDFGEDILGSFKPQLHLIVARQSFDALPRPAVKLPAFALVGSLKEPERMRRDLRRTFQSLIGFLNVVGAMNGQPQFDLDMETAGEGQLVTATYAAEPEEEKSERARIQFNFSPSVGFQGERMVVASTTELAKQLLAAPEAPATPDINTRAVGKIANLRNVLKDNRGQLIAQNILEKGHTRAEAETEIDTLLKLSELLNTISLHLEVDQQLQIQLDVDLSR